MLVSCFNKCVIMRILVKLNIAADLTLFPECTIIIEINIINNQVEFLPNLGNAVTGRGTPPSCSLSLWLVVAILCSGFAATFMLRS